MNTSICHTFIGFQRCIKIPFKHRLIADSSKCSTKIISILLTKLLTHIKKCLQKYCETAYLRSDIDQIWTLKNSKELLEYLKSANSNLTTSIKSFYFSTLYTTISHQNCQSVIQFLRIVWVRLSLWAWDQRHDGEQHLCFLLGIISVDREGQSAAHFPSRQTWRFQLPYHKLSVPE